MYHTEHSENGSPNDNGIYNIVIECSSHFETLSLFENKQNDDQSKNALDVRPSGDDAARRA